MRRLFLFLSLFGLFSLGFCARQQDPVPANAPVLATPHQPGDSLKEQDRIPDKARAVLSHIRRTGKPPAGYVGGRVWHNRERNLPRGGRYREYDVTPKIKGKNRGPERLVVDLASGKAWYTPDHYRTFIPIK